MIDTIEYLKNLNLDTWIGIALVTFLIFRGVKSLILAARGIDDDEI